MTMDSTPDTEIALAFGNQRAVVSPWGGSLRRYFIADPLGGETDILWGYSGGSQKKGGQGDVLIPFPGRVADGRYSFDGQTYQLERNDKEGPNAIHGFVRAMPWRVREADQTRVTFDIGLEADTFGPKGYPFSLSVSLTYGLDAMGLSCSFTVRNAGQQAAPVGVGFHPYFTVGTALVDEAEVMIPGAGYLEFNDRLVPTGRILDVRDTEWDYRRYRKIGTVRFNHCYVHLDRDREGVTTASLRHAGNGRVIDIIMDRSFSALVVYTGDAIADEPRRAVAIEPMTCASDALNHPAWGLTRLLPAQSFTGRYLIRFRRT
jgi:aldose 1-epimerase